MLSPKRTKFRRYHRGSLKGNSIRGNKIAFGEFGIQALSAGWITSRQIEAGRRVMTRYARRGGKLWIRIFPDKPITLRAAESRMGAGKVAYTHGTLAHQSLLDSMVGVLWPVHGYCPTRLVRHERGRGAIHLFPILIT